MKDFKMRAAPSFGAIVSVGSQENATYLLSFRTYKLNTEMRQVSLCI
jgi:hypothetical protein